MTRLTIREASKKFGLSRARLYDLLARNCIAGFRSMERGRKAKSWVDADSLASHIENRAEKQRLGSMIFGNDKYVPVRIAAEKTGYSTGYIYSLARQGSIGIKRLRPGKRSGLLIYLKDLEGFKKVLKGT
jgi:predicted DNA-binding transcriptional regulator AlpA